MPNTDTFDFSDASKGALDDLTQLVAASPSAPEAETPAPEPEPEVAAADAPAPDPPAEPPSDFFEVTAAGQRLRVPKDELIKGYQRDFDYRQKTMALAEERRVLENERAQIRQAQLQLQDVLGNPAKQAELIRQVQEQQGIPQDDNEVLTYGQVKALMRAEHARLEHEIAEKQRQERFEADKARYEHEYTRDLTGYAKDLVAKYPVLADVDKIDLLLLADARDSQPSSVEEVKAAMADSAARRAARLSKRVEDHTKMAVVRQAKLAKATIEPPGAQSPPPTAPRSRALRVGDADLTAQVIADLSAGKR